MSATPALAQRGEIVMPGGVVPAGTMAPPSSSDVLAMNLRVLAANPRDVNALTQAGISALAVGDPNAALGFFARADQISPINGRVKAGLGAAMVMMERPADAMPLFAQAASFGVPEQIFAKDRGLARDLLGDPRSAQRDYALALRSGADPEITRRLALSMGISGDGEQALRLLQPLLRQQDQGAWRARAFILALNGDHRGAERIVQQVMPSGMGSAMSTFLRKLPTLGLSARAAAVHFGTMPSSGPTYASLEPSEALRAIPGTMTDTLTREEVVQPSYAAASEKSLRRTEKEKRRRPGRDSREDDRMAAAVNRSNSPVEVALNTSLPAPTGRSPRIQPAIRTGEGSQERALPPALVVQKVRPVAVAELPAVLPAVRSGPPAAAPAVAAQTAEGPMAPVFEISPGPLPTSVQPSRVAAVSAPSPSAPFPSAPRPIAATLPTPAPAVLAPAVPSPTPARVAVVLEPKLAPPAALPVAAPLTPVSLPVQAAAAAPPSQQVPLASPPPPVRIVAAEPGFSTPASGLTPAAAPLAAAPLQAVPVPVAQRPVPQQPVPQQPVSVPSSLSSAGLAQSPQTVTTGTSPAATQALATPQAAIGNPIAPVLAGAPLATPPANPAPASVAVSVAAQPALMGPPAPTAPNVAPASVQIAAPAIDAAVAAAGRSVPVTFAGDVVAAAPEAATNTALADPQGAGLFGLLEALTPEDEKPAAASVVGDDAFRKARLAARKRAEDEAKAKIVAETKSKLDSETKLRKAEEEVKKAESRRNPERVWVQVATGSAKNGIGITVKRVREQAGDALKGAGAASVPFKATNRILMGPYGSDAEARRVVSALAKKGVKATTFTSTAGQEVAKLPSK